MLLHSTETFYPAMTQNKLMFLSEAGKKQEQLTAPQDFLDAETPVLQFSSISLLCPFVTAWGEDGGKGSIDEPFLTASPNNLIATIILV